MIRKYSEIFCWKNVSSFCIAKATHIFSAKNFRILYIESAKTVKEMTLNELVKLTTLWTTGPWCARKTILLPLPIWDRLFAHVRNFYLTLPGWSRNNPPKGGRKKNPSWASSCRLGKSHSQGRNFNQGLGKLIRGWNSYPSGEFFFFYPAWTLMMDSYNRGQ